MQQLVYPSAALVGISQDNTVRLQDGRGVTLQVQQGTVWVTQDGSSQDIFLAPGESFVVERNGLTLMSHCGATPLALVAVSIPAEVVRPTRLTAFLRRLAVGYFGWPRRLVMSWA